METKLESTHTWFEDLSFHDRLFGVDEDGVVGLGWGDGNHKAWAPFDTGLELVAVEDHEYSGRTHYWAFTEPLTAPWEVLGLDKVKAVTVYSQHYVYGGPEEGGWGVWTKSPLAVFLVDQGEVNDVAVQRAEAAAAKWVAGNEYNEDDVVVFAEPFPLSHTSVGRHYYC